MFPASSELAINAAYSLRTDRNEIKNHFETNTSNLSRKLVTFIIYYFLGSYLLIILHNFEFHKKM